MVFLGVNSADRFDVSAFRRLGVRDAHTHIVFAEVAR